MEGMCDRSTQGVMDGNVVAVFDLDGTLTRYDTYLWYLLGYLRRTPRRLPRTWRLPLDVLVFKSRLKDNTWLKKRFLKCILGGLGEDELGSWTRQFVDRLFSHGLREAGIDVLRGHQLQGHRTVLLSASPDIFVREVAVRLGFSECICTMAQRDETGSLTGELTGGNCHGCEKKRRMESFLGFGRTAVYVVAYGDHRSDLPLLQWADEGILINPRGDLLRKANRMALSVMKW